MEFMINYSCYAANNIERGTIANYMHERLKGNKDYIDSRILINLDRGDTYVDVYVWPSECHEPVPDFLQSNCAFMIFCETVSNGLKWEGNW